jgi:hypothetical protein
MYTLDHSHSLAGRHLVQVDEEPSRFSPWSDNVAIAVILPLPTLHGQPFLIRRNSRMLAQNRPLRAGFSKQLAFKKDTFFGFGFIGSTLYVTALRNELARFPFGLRCASHFPGLKAHPEFVRAVVPRRAKIRSVDRSDQVFLGDPSRFS